MYDDPHPTTIVGIKSPIKISPQNISSDDFNMKIPSSMNVVRDQFINGSTLNSYNIWV